MKDRKMQINVKTLMLYLSGFLIIGLGINLQLRSLIGVGAWDSTNLNLNLLMAHVFPSITKGMTSLMISSMLFLSVMIYRKWDVKLFIMLIPMFTISLSIDFWDLLVFPNYHPEELVIRLILFGIGLFILPLGLSLIITSKFPATVFDEFTIMLVDILHAKNFGVVRLGFEVSGVLLAVIFGFFAGVNFGFVNIGTLIMAITLGPLMNVYLKWFGVSKNV